MLNNYYYNFNDKSVLKHLKYFGVLETHKSRIDGNIIAKITDSDTFLKIQNFFKLQKLGDVELLVSDNININGYEYFKIVDFSEKKLLEYYLRENRKNKIRILNDK